MQVRSVTLDTQTSSGGRTNESDALDTMTRCSTQLLLVREARLSMTVKHSRSGQPQVVHPPEGPLMQPQALQPLSGTDTSRSHEAFSNPATVRHSW